MSRSISIILRRKFELFLFGTLFSGIRKRTDGNKTPTGWIKPNWTNPFGANGKRWERCFLKNIFLDGDTECCFSSVTQSCPTLQLHGLQHARLPCPPPTPGDYSNSCPSSQWCHPANSSSVMPFSCLQSSPASGSFQTSQFFSSGGPSIGVSASASVLPMNIQDWFPLGFIWIFIWIREPK